MLKRAQQPNDRSGAIAQESCPYCQRSCDVISAPGNRLECMSCGAIFDWGRAAYEVNMEYRLAHDPRHELEDPDDRPYLWDLE